MCEPSRGGCMRVILAMAAVAWLGSGGAAAGQSWQPPADAQRCPSKWGAADQRGSGNHMKPETVLRAARLITTGEVFELGRVLSEAMPMPPVRRFELFTKRTRNDPGTNRRGSQRGAGRGRDRPGGHAVRHLQPPDDRRQPLQLRPARRGGQPHRLHQARRGTGRRADDAWRAARHRGAQGRADAGRDLPDHAAGSAGGAGARRSSRCSPATRC